MTAAPSRKPIKTYTVKSGIPHHLIEIKDECAAEQAQVQRLNYIVKSENYINEDDLGHPTAKSYNH